VSPNFKIEKNYSFASGLAPSLHCPPFQSIVVWSSVSTADHPFTGHAYMMNNLCTVKNMDTVVLWIGYNNLGIIIWVQAPVRGKQSGSSPSYF